MKIKNYYMDDEGFVEDMQKELEKDPEYIEWLEDLDKLKEQQGDYQDEQH